MYMIKSFCPKIFFFFFFYSPRGLQLATYVQYTIEKLSERSWRTMSNHLPPRVLPALCLLFFSHHHRHIECLYFMVWHKRLSREELFTVYNMYGSHPPPLSTTLLSLSFHSLMQHWPLFFVFPQTLSTQPIYIPYYVQKKKNDGDY